MFNFRDSYICAENINYLEQIIMDIERYPEFVPWCEQAKILEIVNQEIVAKLIIMYKGIISSYTSRVSVDKTMPAKVCINIVSEQNPLKFLQATWTLDSLAENTTKVEFSIKFSFKSLFLHRLLNRSFDKVCKQMMSSFQAHIDDKNLNT